MLERTLLRSSSFVRLASFCPGRAGLRTGGRKQSASTVIDACSESGLGGRLGCLRRCRLRHEPERIADDGELAGQALPAGVEQRRAELDADEVLPGADA